MLRHASSHVDTEQYLSNGHLAAVNEYGDSQPNQIDPTMFDQLPGKKQIAQSSSKELHNGVHSSVHEEIKAQEKPVVGFLEGFYKTKNSNFNILKVLTLSCVTNFYWSLLRLKMASLAAVILLELNILSKLNMEILVG